MNLYERFETAFMPNYGVPPVALARGEGTRVWDVDGNEYLDFIGGIATSSLGHAHPALVEAVSKQVATIAHTSNLFLHEPEVLLAEKLLDLLNAPGKVFFANSGTEANEAAYKLAVKYGKREGRSYFVAAENGFHGRTIGALSLTGKPSIRDQFGPFPIDVRFVPYGDATALKEAVTGDCIAVFLEPTRARPAWSRRPRATSRRPARSATPRAPSWWPTRSSPRSAAPATGSRTRPTASRPTS